MEKLRAFFEGKKKERINLLLLIFIGGLFILISSKNFIGNVKEEPKKTEEIVQLNEDPNSYEKELEKRLEEILCQVDGAGVVDVMITFSQMETVVVEKNKNEVIDTSDEIDNSGGTRIVKKSQTDEEVVLITDSDGNTEPLILYKTVPKVEGVIIVAQGGGDIKIRESLIRSAVAALDVSINKVEVLKRK